MTDSLGAIILVALVVFAWRPRPEPRYPWWIEWERMKREKRECQ